MNIWKSGGGVTGICCALNGIGMDVAMVGDVRGICRGVDDQASVCTHTVFCLFSFPSQDSAEVSATLSPQSGLSVGTRGSSRGLDYKRDRS